MSIVVALATLALLAAVIAVISGPLRAARRGPDAASLRRAELEAAREAKYREIRDTELDFATGKLSDEDHDAIEAALRAEAMEILRELDALGEPAREQ
jgi:hypothetical protein